jgi:hypothetical protein
MENKRISSVIIFIVTVVFVSIVTNPSAETQKQIIYYKQNSQIAEYLYMNSHFGPSNNFLKNMNLITASIFVNAEISHAFNNEIQSINLLAFTLLKDNENQLFGIGAFGRIYFISDKFDEILKNRIEERMQSFDLYQNENGFINY